MKSASIEDIKQNLIGSCVTFDAFHFLPYLLSPVVEIDFPNKIRFYRFLKYLLNFVIEEATGSLKLRIESEPWEGDKELFAYNFYDEVHKYPQINLQIKEMEVGFLLT